MGISMMKCTDSLNDGVGHSVYVCEVVRCDMYLNQVRLPPRD